MSLNQTSGAAHGIDRLQVLNPTVAVIVRVRGGYGLILNVVLPIENLIGYWIILLLAVGTLLDILLRTLATAGCCWLSMRLLLTGISLALHSATSSSGAHPHVYMTLGRVIYSG